jgi:hypothetical protein
MIGNRSAVLLWNSFVIYPSDVRQSFSRYLRINWVMRSLTKGHWTWTARISSCLFAGADDLILGSLRGANLVAATLMSLIGNSFPHCYCRVSIVSAIPSLTQSIYNSGTETSSRPVLDCRHGDMRRMWVTTGQQSTL